MMLSLGSIQGYIVLLLLRSLSGFVLKSQLTSKDRVFVGGAIAAIDRYLVVLLNFKLLVQKMLN